jgi:hypothetical protein
MIVSLVLHTYRGDKVLFLGPASECPPIPRTGEEILHQSRRLRLEAIQYRYRKDHLEIALLA